VVQDQQEHDFAHIAMRATKLMSSSAVTVSRPRPRPAWTSPRTSAG
jgi:hypothetical protein